jgi:hypothetical protein
VKGDEEHGLDPEEEEAGLACETVGRFEVIVETDAEGWVGESQDHD